MNYREKDEAKDDYDDLKHSLLVSTHQTYSSGNSLLIMA